jgi:peptidoglycan/LPS O-acetylase OafA/YrhL
MGRSLSHRADLQGLRAVAVLLVALGHAGVGFLRGGFVGVDVFFVLSGFLITGILLAEARESGSVSLVRFYVRRARRILPAAALTLLATELAAYVLLNFVRAREVVWDGLAAAAFAANFRFAEQGTDYFAQAQPPSPLLHFWSLAVEEQFYLVWPALLSIVLLGAVVARRRRRVGPWQERRLLLVVVVLASASLWWSVHLTAVLPPAAYFSPFTRAWELALGAALAVGAPTVARVPQRWRARMGWSGLLAIGAGAVLFSEGTPFPGYAAVLPTVGAALVIGAGIAEGSPQAVVGRLLALAPMRFVGDRSYAFYLWHWPVLIIGDAYAGRGLSVGVKLLLLAGAFGLSIVSYALVENPIRRARWSARRTSVVCATSMAVVLVAAGLSLRGIDRAEKRFSSPVTTAPMTVELLPLASYTPDARAEDASAWALPEVVAAVRAARRGARIPTGLTPPIGQLRNEPLPYSLPRGCVPIANSSQSTSRICRVGRATSRRSIVVIGDSHAQMWMPSILRMAERDGWAVIPLLRPGCLPESWIANRGLAACRPWYRWATRQARLLHPTVTLVGGAVGGLRGAAAQAAENGMIAMARAVRPASDHVVVMGDPEGLTRSPIDCLLSRHASMASCTATWSPALLEPYDNIAARTEELGLGFLDTRGWFCWESRCPAVIGRTIAYKDPHHITSAYALRLTWTFRAAFLRELRAG